MRDCERDRGNERVAARKRECVRVLGRQREHQGTQQRIDAHRCSMMPENEKGPENRALRRFGWGTRIRT